MPSIETLRATLSSQLPSYMVPASFTVLEELPLTTSGKVDRRRLPEPGLGDRPALEQAYVEPEGDTETRLAGIFAEVLRVERVGALDNYFALGGDSIRSIQVLSRAHSEGLHFTLPQLFSGPTVRELATQVRRGEPVELVQRTAPLSLLASEDKSRLPLGIEDAYPLIELQAGMLFHAAYSAETSVYHDVFGCRVGAAWMPTRCVRRWPPCRPAMRRCEPVLP